MSKPTAKSVSGGTAKKPRGRTAQTQTDEPRITRPNVSEEARAATTRPIGPGPGHRGDRRDTSRLYTNNTKHAARGSAPRADVKTRKR